MINPAMIAAAMPGLEKPQQGPQMDAKERAFWNGFVDYVQKKGLKGSPELDRRDLSLSKKLFSEYSAANGGEYDYDTFIPRVQQHISDYRTKAIGEIRAGRSAIDGYSGDVNQYDFDKRFMSGLSAVDGWAGSKTTSWRFPNEKMVVTDQHGKKIDERPNTVFQDISRVPVLSEINKREK